MGLEVQDVGNLTSPFEIAAVALAFGWPFAAGLGVVLWSKARAARRERRHAEVDADLKGMFRAVEDRPAPERLTMVVDALEESEALQGSLQEAATKTPKRPATAV